MKKIIFYFIVLVNTFQIACSQNKEPVTVEQVPSNYSSILYANSKEGKIISVKFYLTFDITNNTDDEISLSFPEYISKGTLLKQLYRGWRTVIPVYFNQNENLEIVFGNKEVEGLEKLKNTPKEYVFVARHEFSQDSSVQSLFSYYLEKIKIENKDTLHIGTITELKQKGSPILQSLEGDSILISFGRNDIYLDPIPVQIK